MMTSVDCGKCLTHASSISSALRTGTKVTPSGLGRNDGPETSTTSAPLLLAALAIA